MLISPLLFQSEEEWRNNLNDVSKNLSSAFNKNGVKGIKSEFAKLSANVYIEVKDGEGNTLTSNIVDKEFFYLFEKLNSTPEDLSGKTSVNFHYRALFLNHKLTAYIVILDSTLR